MKIDHQRHYQESPNQIEAIDKGLKALIQLYATELNYQELMKGSIVDSIDWEYLETILLNQLEKYPESAAQEANYTYFEMLKDMFEVTKKDNQ